MKKKISFFALLLLLISISSASIELPKPTSKFFVNDFANVINSSDEETILNMASRLYEESENSTQVVVVTIDSLNGYSIEEYANELFNTWGIGDKERNDGVLILLSVGDRESRIEVGYGLEGVLTDSGTGRIQDEYMIPYYENNNFSKGLVSGTEAVCDIINGELVIDGKINNDTQWSLTDFVMYIVLGALLSIPIYLSFKKFRVYIFVISGVVLRLGGDSLLMLPKYIFYIFLGIFCTGLFFCIDFIRYIYSVMGGGRFSGGGRSSGGSGSSGGGGSSRGF